MSRVRGRDTAPEMRVRRAAHAKGLRYRLHRGDLPGRPDMVFPGRRVAVFVHGCFWHRHPNCTKASTPKSNLAFWEEKFARNVERDRRVRSELESDGWTVLTVWECETKNPERLAAFVEKIEREEPQGSNE